MLFSGGFTFSNFLADVFSIFIFDTCGLGIFAGSKAF